jgi:endonuclease G
LFDPCWGDASDPAQALAESKLTNAAPQVQTYNDIDWGEP